MTTFEIAQALAAQNDLIKLLLDKLNRIEAATAHAKPVEQPDTVEPTIEYAIALLDRAVTLYGQQSDSYRAMVMELRRGR